MLRRFRFGDYLQEVSIRHRELSYNLLMPEPARDAEGRYVPVKPVRLKLKAVDFHRLLAPYVSVRFLEQFRAVFPLAVYLGIFQLVVLRQSIAGAASIAAGLFSVMLGLMFFMEGLKLGLMPYGETIGNTLPRKATLRVVMTIAFVLGVGVTFAEPAVGALQEAGRNVDVLKAPYLYTLLTDRSPMLVLVIALAAGAAAVLGMLRFVFGWGLKPLIFAILVPNLAMTIGAQFHPELSKIVGLAWDSGGAVAGGVTVPLVLALGIGVASAVGRGTSSLSGFGIVTLTSLLPVSMVLLYGGYVVLTVSPESIIESATQAQRFAASVDLPWWDRSPGHELVAALRAILPLLLFLFLVLRVVIRERVPHAGIIRYGIGLTLIGMVLFNLGLSHGLSRLGDQSGSLIPATFSSMPQVAASPLYGFSGGILVTCIFAWLLGFGSTLAEPAINALASTVEDLTSGTLRKRLLRLSIAVGAASGITIGVLKTIFGFSLGYVLIPAYLLALVLTWFSSEEMVNLGWDAAGVTAGPVTVPLVLAMGLGLGNAVGAVDSFGILATASVFSVFPILTVGLLVDTRSRRVIHG
ncbi:MAG TPA: DUF1538 family protein [Bdellovibrionota bacterium]|nr:DUF1538 family protein [Bdellovibrionota bacterium]